MGYGDCDDLSVYHLLLALDSGVCPGKMPRLRGFDHVYKRLSSPTGGGVERTYRDQLRAVWY
jgi:hypothetical protein